MRQLTNSFRESKERVKLLTWSKQCSEAVSLVMLNHHNRNRNILKQFLSCFLKIPMLLGYNAFCIIMYPLTLAVPKNNF